MNRLGLSREKSDQLRDIGVLTSMFFEAAETERRLPPAYRKKVGVAWPDNPDEKVAYGYTDAVARLSPAGRNTHDARKNAPASLQRSDALRVIFRIAR